MWVTMFRASVRTYNASHAIAKEKGWADKPRLGVHAVARIVPQDYGFPALFGNTIEIAVDTEFERAP